MRRCEIRSVVALAIGVAIVVASPAVADLILKDSADFNHKYEGDVAPVPNYTEVGTFQLAPTTDGDIMSFRTGFGPYLGSDDWNGANAPDGYTIEIRARIGTDFAEGARGALALYTGIGGTTGDLIGIGQSSVKILAHGEILVDTNDNTADFHTFRVAFDHVGSVWPYTIYRDGVLLDSWPNGGNWATESLWIGSGGSIYGGPTVEVDYIRWDDTGAFAPIPEPASLALLGVGSLLLATARRRR